MKEAANPACPTSDTSTITAKPQHPQLWDLVKAMGAMPTSRT
jgi:hypothetical protein